MQEVCTQLQSLDITSQNNVITNCTMHIKSVEIPFSLQCILIQYVPEQIKHLYKNIQNINNDDQTKYDGFIEIMMKILRATNKIQQKMANKTIIQSIFDFNQEKEKSISKDDEQKILGLQIHAL